MGPGKTGDWSRRKNSVTPTEPRREDLPHPIYSPQDTVPGPDTVSDSQDRCEDSTKNKTVVKGPVTVGTVCPACLLPTTESDRPRRCPVATGGARTGHEDLKERRLKQGTDLCQHRREGLARRRASPESKELDTLKLLSFYPGI